MKHLHRFLAPAGVILLLFGLVPYTLARVLDPDRDVRFDAWTALHVIGGLLILAIAISLNLAGFRRTMAERGTRPRAWAVLGTLVFAAVLVTINVVAARHPWRFDATENKIHTLTERTKAVVQSLDRDVEILAFLEAGDPSRKRLEDLLGRYAALSPRLAWRFVDAVQDPPLAERLNVHRQGTIVARAGETSAQTSPEESGGATEGAITNLILKVSRPGPKVAYVLSGHGEPSVEDVSDPAGLGLLSQALREQNFEVRTLLLSAKPVVPDDAACVLVVGPRKPLIGHELDELRAYLARGGRLLLLLDPALDAGLADLLTDYRIELQDDMVVDQEEIPFLGARLGLNPIVESFLPHPITKGFKERIVLLQARSVGVRLEGGLPGVEAHDLAETSHASWAEKDYRAMLSTGKVTKDASDRPGPITIAAAASIESKPAGGEAAAKGDGSRLVVVGDSDFAINGNLDAYFNHEFLLNVVEWLAGRDELIAEGPRGFRASRLNMSEADTRMLFRLGVLVLPETLLILGFGIRWWRRSL